MDLTLGTASVQQAWAVYQRLPEFADGHIDQPGFERTLAADSAIVLVAHLHGEAVGFKAGYDRFGDGSFYSWLGGVAPAARRAGVAQQLLLEQERLVSAAGFNRIYVKSRNRFVGMLTLLLRNGYAIVGVALPDGEALADGRIMLTKELSSA